MIIRGGRYGYIIADARPTPTACRPGLRTGPTTTEESSCPRCGSEMIWVKASWHCTACRYKQGCC